ncbi:MAG: RDD family protein [Oscillochloridaceae bacterium umkhey_bin13]
MSNERYLVETPEIVTLEYAVAGAGSRCMAAVIDTLLILLLQLALGFVIVMLTSLAGVGLEALNEVALTIWALLGFGLIWGFYLGFELLWSGQTPGKRMFGLRVIREGGRPLDFSASAIRNLVRAVDFLPFGYGVGLLTMVADRWSRRPGDLAAGTLVVREGVSLSLADLSREVRPVAVPPRAPGAPAAPLLPDLHLAQSHDYDLAEAFLRRRNELRPARRSELATMIASQLRTRLSLPAQGDPERFIEHFVREYRVFHQR